MTGTNVKANAANAATEQGKKLNPHTPLGGRKGLVTLNPVIPVTAAADINAVLDVRSFSMTRKIAALLVLVFVSSVLAFAADTVSIPFQVKGGRKAVMVELEVNGRKGFFLVDTGSAHTVVDAAFLSHDGRFASSAFTNNTPGMTLAGRQERLSIGFGKNIWMPECSVMDLSQASQVYGFRIDGLLGQDIMAAYDSVNMDYKAKALVLTKL